MASLRRNRNLHDQQGRARRTRKQVLVPIAPRGRLDHQALPSPPNLQSTERDKTGTKSDLTDIEGSLFRVSAAQPADLVAGGRPRLSCDRNVLHVYSLAKRSANWIAKPRGSRLCPARTSLQTISAALTAALPSALSAAAGADGGAAPSGMWTASTCFRLCVAGQRGVGCLPRWPCCSFVVRPLPNDCRATVRFERLAVRWLYDEVSG